MICNAHEPSVSIAAAALATEIEQRALGSFRGARRMQFMVKAEGALRSIPEDTLDFGLSGYSKLGLS
jgi:hypothetical protein